MSREWKEAQRRLAGGVNSPVRAFRAVGGEPLFMKQAKGATLTAEGGKRYADFCLSWGAILLGHGDNRVAKVVARQAAKGTSFGTATVYETKLAAEIQKAFPNLERLRFTSSGTEAVMSAIRLARGVTGRERLLKFDGCYHGHADSLLVKAGSGLATLGTPDSAGVPKSLAGLTSVLPYNDTRAVERFFRKNRDLACAIVEPVAGNMGVVPADQAFLDALAEGCRRTGALLLFDEVISGFRVGYGGAQHEYGIRPDLTTLGKIIGGGLPVGAFGGSAKLMNHLSPIGKVYQAGTLSGNPLSMAAGYSVLSRLSQGFYRRLNDRTASLVDEAVHTLRRRGTPVSAHRRGSMFTLYFRGTPPRDFDGVKASDTSRFPRWFRGMLDAGVYVPPSAFEASFLSAAHGEHERTAYLRGLRKA